MEIINDTINNVSSIIEQYLPSTLPVPPPITNAAKFFISLVESPSFPYRLQNIDITDVVLWQTIIVTFVHPALWNVIARFEYYTRVLSKIFFKPVFGVYALALWIFVAGLYRDLLFDYAIRNQPTLESLGAPGFVVAAYIFLATGATLVLTSFYQLGMTGTYLGDYFGILMEKRVTAFPFNLFSDPMYDGSTMMFLSRAILAKSPAGLLMTAWVYFVYRFMCLFEGPFTAHIYANRNKAKKNA
eukprot:GFKZ01012649.1.p1 GENE.GFKZ01012649.1~~GFKZ01012649.1.p1  ORF type:complete len:243 (-),score=27.95 GFKZ01012649.1:535-1263(-)